MNRKTPCVTQMCTLYSLLYKICQCNYGCELNKKGTCTDKQNSTFHNHWIWLGTKKDADFIPYVPVDKELATCSTYTPLAYCKSKTYRLHARI